MPRKWIEVNSDKGYRREWIRSVDALGVLTVRMSKGFTGELYSWKVGVANACGVIPICEGTADTELGAKRIAYRRYIRFITKIAESL